MALFNKKKPQVSFIMRQVEINDFEGTTEVDSKNQRGRLHREAELC